jgi:hypothetical protein
VTKTDHDSLVWDATLAGAIAGKKLWQKRKGTGIGN